MKHKQDRLKEKFKKFWWEEFGCMECNSNLCGERYEKNIWKFIEKALQTEKERVVEEIIKLLDSGKWWTPPSSGGEASNIKRAILEFKKSSSQG